MLGWGAQSSFLVVSKCKASIPTLSAPDSLKGSTELRGVTGQASGELRLDLPLPGCETLDKYCNHRGLNFFICKFLARLFALCLSQAQVQPH